MGSPEEEPWIDRPPWFGESDPYPVPWKGTDEVLHRVRITRAFCLGVYEVRVKDFDVFVRATGYRTAAERGEFKPLYFDEEAGKWIRDDQRRISWRNPGFPQTAEHPVVQVLWSDAQAFCQWLSEKEGRRYRLPTEAEWEYACRAGTQTAFPGGDDPLALKKYANLADYSFCMKYSKEERDDLDGGNAGVRVFPFDDGYAFTAPVGRFLPNGFGLYDMIGNALEHCSDCYRTDAYEKSPLENPDFSEQPASDPQARSWHVARGGSFGSTPLYARIAERVSVGAAPETAVMAGFRVAITCENE